MNSSSALPLQQQQQGSNRNIAMDLQNQSYAYPQQKRSDIVYVVTSEDEEDLSTIPYHAREDSRPFTYGNPVGIQLNSPTGGTGMLKMQSGLSSPSLVRKTLQPTTPKKVSIRNDFEDMLLQRREKVLNDKYSIGDKTPSVVVASNGQFVSEHQKWNNESDKTGYQNHQQQQHRYEPLKRSNTMDGGFSRSYSTDGGSG